MDDDNPEPDAVSSARLPTRGFPILYQKTLPFPARHGLAAWSPQLDLIALVTSNETVLLYRMNGQRVWGFAHRRDKMGTETRVERLQWRPDGWFKAFRKILNIY